MANYQAAARRIARKYGIPPALFALLIKHESSWNPKAVSPAGAIGLAQLMPGTARGLGVNPFDPLQNLEGGAKYLSQQYKTFGTWKLALAAYNAGPGAVQKYKGLPPFAETKNYVGKIMSAWGGKGGGGGAFPAQSDPLAAMGGLGGDLSGSATSSLQDIISGKYDPLKQLAELSSVAQMGGVSTTPDLPTDVPQPKGGGAWGGSKAIADHYRQLLGLPVTSSKRDTKNTSSGGVSDHWSGNKSAYAYDFGGSVGQMDAAAAKLARALGIKYSRGKPLVATVTRGGYRIQVLYRTMTGGDHFDHIHVGVRRV